MRAFPVFVRFANLALFALGFLLCGPHASRAQAQPTASPAPAAAPTAEDEEKARGHFRLGRAYYDNGDFARAAVEFESAYRISQKPALLYNIYLAYRDANDTKNAAESLRKYLQLEKNVENRGQLESRLAALDRSLAEDAQSTPAPMPAPGAQSQQARAPQPTAAAPAALAVQPTAAAPVIAPNEVEAPLSSAPTSEVATAKPNQMLPIVLMSTGGAMVVASAITGLMAVGKHSTVASAADACKKAGDCQSLAPSRVAELNSDKSSGKTLALMTDIFLFGGLAVAGTGAVLYFVNHGKEQPPPTTTAALMCAPGACLGSVRTSF